MPTLRPTLAALLALGVFAQSSVALAHCFTDVSDDDPFHEISMYMKDEGIVEGYADGSFRPKRTINRMEFAKIVVAATFTPQAWETCDPNHIYSFTDASRNAWYSPYLCVAVQHKIIGGYPDGSVKPDQGISFVEAAKILANAYNLKACDTTYCPDQGSAEAPWYKQYVVALVEERAIPTSIDFFSQLITRAEMADMIHRLDAKITTKPTMYYDAMERNDYCATCE